MAFKIKILSCIDNDRKTLSLAKGEADFEINEPIGCHDLSLF
jgi:hypothetical protein